MKYVICGIPLLCALFNASQAISKDNTRTDRITFNVLAFLYLILAIFEYVYLTGGTVCM